MNPHNHIQSPIRHLVSSLFAGIPQCLFPTIFGSSALIDDPSGGFAVGEPTIYPHWRPEDGSGEDPSGGSVVWELYAHPQEGSGADRGQRRAIINTLPDNVLLDMFDFYLGDTKRIEEWHTLVHVCPRWRYLVFASPRRLRLRLLCTAKRRVGKMLDVFPALPLQIWCGDGSRSLVKGADNIVAALRHSGRVCKIDLQGVPSSVLERIMAVMQCPFPELTDLRLSSTDGGLEPVVPHSFLGGTAAHLRELDLTRVVFPEVGNLLLSASRLVTLCLWDIPNAGHISPEAMVACLSSLTRLESLYLGFRSFETQPDQKSRRLPPPTRTILPALTRLLFKGGCEYLEDLVARISAPLLYNFSSSFFNEPVFDTRQLLQFVSEAEQLRSLNRADVVFYSYFVEVKLYPYTWAVYHEELALNVSCKQLNSQLSSIAQILNSSSPPLSTLERLNISEVRHSRPDRQGDMENFQWLGLLHPFTSVRSLYLSEGIARRVAPALRDLPRERVTEVLPALQDLFLEGLQSSGPVPKAIKQFVATRRLSGHPVAVHRWERWL